MKYIFFWIESFVKAMQRVLIFDPEFSGVSGDMVVAALASLVNEQSIIQAIELICKKFPGINDYSIQFKKQNVNGIIATKFDLRINGCTDYPAIDYCSSSKIDASNESHKHQHAPEQQHSQQHEPEQQHSQQHAPEQQFEQTNHERNPSSMEKSQKQSMKFPRLPIEKLGEILQSVLSLLNIPQQAVLFAKKIFEILIEAEAEVHGIQNDQVHLHEIGSIDTIIDIIGVTVGLSELKVFEGSHIGCKSDDSMECFKVMIKPISVGGGMIKIDHGILPVPAPATKAILKKYNLKFKEGPVLKELATPTGVAILAAIKTFFGVELENQKMIFTIQNEGIATGNLRLEDRPNIFSIRIGTIENTDSNQFTREVSHGNIFPYLGKYSQLMRKIVILETNLDDITGEHSGTLVSELISIGAFDVSLISTVSKKNRAGLILRVVVDHDLIEPICDKIFNITGTLGMRIQETDRICLEREFRKHIFEYDNNKYEVSSKIARDPSGNYSSIKIEYEDLVSIQKQTGLPIKILEQKILAQITPKIK